MRGRGHAGEQDQELAEAAFLRDDGDAVVVQETSPSDPSAPIHLAPTPRVTSAMVCSPLAVGTGHAERLTSPAAPSRRLRAQLEQPSSARSGRNAAPSRDRASATGAGTQPALTPRSAHQLRRDAKLTVGLDGDGR